jgi:hypothetical protein
MPTKDILFGMNILTLAGFLVIGITLTLNRMGQAGKAVSIGLMTAGRLWYLPGCMREAGSGNRLRAAIPARCQKTNPCAVV